MFCKLRLWVVLLVVSASSYHGSCVNYVTLNGTLPSSPEMICEDKKFFHTKPDGEELNVEHLSGEDGLLLINKVENEDEDDKYSLVIKLPKEAAKNNHLFIGEWRCNEHTWIVKGEPYIERLSLDWDLQEKHRQSTTVNEGNDVKLVCEAFVIAEENDEPVFSWDIDPEKGVTDAKAANYSRWENSKSEEVTKNHWKSTYQFVVPGGITKEDRYSYKCTVKVGQIKPLERSQEMLIRVKGKYAVLWPAIGIVFEVLILGIGTWLYEKRKSKSEPAVTEAKDADTSDTGLVQPSSSTGAVRKRNTVDT